MCLDGCETCTYYSPMPLNSGGECTDPAKVIYAGGGDRVNSEPNVWPRYECLNHKTEKNAQNEV